MGPIKLKPPFDILLSVYKLILAHKSCLEMLCDQNDYDWFLAHGCWLQTTLPWLLIFSLCHLMLVTVNIRNEIWPNEMLFCMLVISCSDTAIEQSCSLALCGPTGKFATSTTSGTTIYCCWLAFVAKWSSETCDLEKKQMPDWIVLQGVFCPVIFHWILSYITTIECLC